MPVSVKKKGDKYRIVEKGGKIAKNAKGVAIDGGGHKAKSKADKQARAINGPNYANGAKYE